MAKFALLIASQLLFGGLAAEEIVIDGVRYECRDGMCVMVGETEDRESGASEDRKPSGDEKVRLAAGYMEAEALVDFITGREREAPHEVPTAWKWVAVFAAMVFGGLMMNLTPCVLPMVPVTLMVVGRSWQRGLVYGLGMAVAYGGLGVVAALGGLAFGVIQSSAWFNLAVAVVFAVLALAMAGVWRLDFARFRRSRGGEMRSTAFFAFGAGVLAAVLAGACVAPVLASALVLTADWYARGELLALFLPFALGLGMALPWPFLGMGLKVLPRPGAWMKWVNRILAVAVMGLAAWYFLTAAALFGWWRPSAATDGGGDWIELSSPAELDLSAYERPLFIDCWASWCKNCTAMERTTLRDGRVRSALQGFTKIRLRCEDLTALKELPSFGRVPGLPVFAIVEAPVTGSRP